LTSESFGPKIRGIADIDGRLALHLLINEFQEVVQLLCLLILQLPVLNMYRSLPGSGGGGRIAWQHGHIVLWGG
jgi:hypothetical protein